MLYDTCYMIHKYLKWNEKIITDFNDNNINSLYNKGYVFTRLGKGIMNQTRSLRIDLSKFELSSENKRILRKTEQLRVTSYELPFTQYNWSVGKIAKDFYETKFGAGIFTANKIKELLTNSKKSNFNKLLVYKIDDDTAGYAICYETNEILHYSYPFYNLKPESYKLIPNLGMSMMLKAILSAKKNKKKYIYLGSAQHQNDVYKLQFVGLEWFDGKIWNNNLEELKNILKK